MGQGGGQGGSPPPCSPTAGRRPALFSASSSSPLPPFQPHLAPDAFLGSSREQGVRLQLPPHQLGVPMGEGLQGFTSILLWGSGAQQAAACEGGCGVFYGVHLGPPVIFREDPSTPAWWPGSAP